MRAAYYEQNGRAADVLRVGEIDTPVPGPGEVRVKLKTSGINPSDVKGRAGLTRKIAFARVVPHSDGAGEIDVVGAGVPQARVGERVWTFNAQWKRASGTAAEYVVLPSHQAVALPTSVNFDVGAGIGIPAMTAWYAVDLALPAEGAARSSFRPAPALSATTRFNSLRRDTQR
jgi:NADPH2:quinone reductase